MKNFVYLIASVVSIYIGYQHEPTLRPKFFTPAPEKKSTSSITKEDSAEASKTTEPTGFDTPSTDTTPEPTPAPAAPEVAPTPSLAPEPSAVETPAPKETSQATVPEENEELTDKTAKGSNPIIITAMKMSINRKKLKGIKNSDQIIGWKSAPDEVINGVKYQIGLVAYKQETVFGYKQVKAKALIQSSTVQRWVWAKSNSPIN